MIKFFRKIRYNLMETGKTSRYLKYAIGEIILVVIGILIALSINNWNSGRIDRIKENIYLKNIQRDLKEQLASIELQIDYENHIIKLATPMVAYYKTNQGFKIDSAFTSNIGNLISRKTFVKKAPTYTELISSGNIDMIRNNSAKDDIIKYYQEMERIELIINKNNNLYVDMVFLPEMMGLSEIQLPNDNTLGGLIFQKPNFKSPLIDLNEPRLKQNTQTQLENPENELKMINLINYRNFISFIHVDILTKQKENTQQLLDKLNTDD